jgi:Rps23 Pro-64 3,4-dihydroxylase Tpa1-like proline 4-hydroxylase
MSMLDHRDLLRANVHVVESFATQDELTKILDECLKFEKWDNTWVEYVDGARDNGVPVCAESIAVSSRALFFVSAKIGRRLSFLYHPYLRKYPAGSYLKMHADSEGFYEDGADPLRYYDPNNLVSEVLNEYSSILYLNDDYLGGELYFEELDVLIKPKSNQLVFFPSGCEFRHEVKPVLDGDRYTLASFYSTDKLIGLHSKIRELI